MESRSMVTLFLSLGEDGSYISGLNAQMNFCAMKKETVNGFKSLQLWTS